MVGDLLKRIRLIVEETLRSFLRNRDLTSASSLAFSASLALIPALFLVAYLLGLAVGSSHTALVRLQELLEQLLPAYSQDVLREVRQIVAYKGAIGVVNISALLLTITPLASGLRGVLGTIFRRRPERPFLLEKFYDLLLTIIFLTGIAAIGAAGVMITVLHRDLPFPSLVAYFKGASPVLFFVVTVFLLYLAFSKGMPKAYLLTGALLSASLWFLLRPLFHLFLTYNAGFGFAFGSFKSLFVVILWLYYSLIVFLLGAELARSLDRCDLAVLRRLTMNRTSIPAALAERSTVRYPAGERVFSEGDEGDCIYYVLNGSVSLRKNDREIAFIGPGRYVGEVSFLLERQRMATAVATDDTELLVINRTNLALLMQDSPEFVLSLLRAIAHRIGELHELME